MESTYEITGITDRGEVKATRFADTWDKALRHAKTLQGYPDIHETKLERVDLLEKLRSAA